MNDDLQTGTVKWYNGDKGYGFILPDDTREPDVFVHASALPDSGLKTLREGQRVKFKITSERGKIKATNIRLAG